MTFQVGCAFREGEKCFCFVFFTESPVGFTCCLATILFDRLSNWVGQSLLTNFLNVFLLWKERTKTFSFISSVGIFMNHQPMLKSSFDRMTTAQLYTKGFVYHNTSTFHVKSLSYFLTFPF